MLAWGLEGQRQGIPQQRVFVKEDRLPFPVAGVIDLGDPPTQILHATEDKLRPRELIVS